jgi:RHS repeat-associated protein
VVGILAAAVGASQSGPDNDPAQAQGYVNNHFHASSVDALNLYNGQLTIPIAIGPVYRIGPNLTFQATLTYNTRVKEPGRPTAENNPNYFPVVGDPAIGIGWTFSPGKIACGALPTSVGLQPCYVRPDGAQIDFVAATGKTLDGSQYELVHNGAPPSDSYTMFDGDGNRYEFARRVAGYDDDARQSPSQGPGYARDYGRGRDGYYLTSLEDPFGNRLTVEYAPGGVQPCPSVCTAPPIPVGSMRCSGATAVSWIPASFRIQRVGETAPTEIGQVVVDGSLERIRSLTFKTFRGGASQFSQWDLSYGTLTLGNRDPSLYCPTPLWVLNGIALPADITGTPGYAFTYHASGAAIALMKTMTVPTGATIYYDYGNYHFYHGRRALFSPSDPCSEIPSPPPPAQGVRRSAILTDSGGPGNRPESDGGPERYAPTLGPCLPYTDSRQFEQTAVGVLQRAVTGPGLTDAVTNYTQYSFPFGEHGNTDAQTLTVALLPADADGRRRAETTLFWAAKQVVDPSELPTPGDRLGADIRHAIFESDPNPSRTTLLTPPLCGGSVEEDRLCATHAVRVVQNLYQYDVDGPALPTPRDDGALRRLRSSTTYYGWISALDPLAADYCTGCPKHSVTYSLAGANTWTGNGNHYERESHAGTLGGDRSEVITAWTPQPVSRLKNLYSSRVETDPDIAPASGPTGVRHAIERSFFFDPSTGFLRGQLTWDAPTSRYAASCRYPDAAGNLSDEVTANVVTVAGKPASNPCFASVADWAPGVIGLNSDAFGQRHGYAAGLPASRRWIQDRTPLPWHSYRVDRDGATGWVRASYDTAGIATTFLYDSLGRVTSVAPTGEAATAIAYVDARTTRAVRSGADDSSWEQFHYDGLGRLVREIRQMPSGYAFRTHDFDAAGHSRFVSEWTACASAAAAGDCATGAATLGTTFSNFDPLGRAQTVTKADGSVTTISLTDGGTPHSDTRKAVTTSNVGCSWNGTACAGGVASTTAYRYDAFGRLTTVMEPGGDITTYSYDAAGRLVSVTQGAQTRTFSYDALGYLIRETTPEAGTVDYTALSGSTTYAFWGSLGNPRGRVDGYNSTSPVTRSYQYDAAGRLLCEISGSFSVGQSCDAAGLSLYVRNYYDGSGFPGGAFPQGKLTRRDGYNRVLAPTLTVREEFTYSHLNGRLSQEATSVRSGSTVMSTAAQSWSYDALGLVKTHGHPRPSGDFVVTNSRSFGYVTGITAGGQSVVSQTSYGPSGALSSWMAGNGVVTSVEPDSALLPRPSRIRTSGAVPTASGGNFDSGTFHYDGAGNVVAMGTDAFGYDARSRLTKATYAGIGSQLFSYDRYGNLLSDGATTFCAGTCANNRLAAPYAYDARGNLKANGTAETLTYDDLSRQVREQRPGGVDWRYLYDGGGERTAKVPSGGTTQYTYRDEGNRVATEYYGATLGRDNVFLGNLLVASYVSSTLAGTPGWHWYHSDHLGTPRLVTDSSKSIVESRKYWPYGDGVPGQSGTLQKLRFCAMERDSENSHYYDHARMHDAVVGRFTSPDSLRGNSNNGQSWNRYLYGAGNPIKYSDPNGQQTGWAEALGDDLMRTARDVMQRASEMRATRPSESLALAAVVAGAMTLDEVGDDLRLGADIGSAIGVQEGGQEALDAEIGRLGALLTIASAASAVPSLISAARFPASYTVIGHLDDTAKFLGRPGANVLRVPREQWNWETVNVAFLNVAYQRGEPVYVASVKIRPGSITEREIAWFRARGYKGKGRWLIKVVHPTH